MFFESPYRLLKVLKILQEVLPKRKIAVVREISKLHESVVRGSVEEVIEHFSKEKPLGEIVLVVSGKNLE